MKSFTLFTMKSKQVWMKSSLCSDEIKSVHLIRRRRFHLRSRFHPRSGFIPSQDGFSWKKHFRRSAFFWRHHPDLNWGIKLLQSSALPLGYGAILNCMMVSRQIFSIFIVTTIIVYHILLVLSIHFFKLYDIF